MGGTRSAAGGSTLLTGSDDGGRGAVGGTSGGVDSLGRAGSWRLSGRCSAWVSVATVAASRSRWVVMCAESASTSALSAVRRASSASTSARDPAPRHLAGPERLLLRGHDDLGALSLGLGHDALRTPPRPAGGMP